MEAVSREELLKIAKPILFNTKMVRAILDGRKTVTRRICKDANEFTVPDMSFYDADKRTYVVHNYANKEHTDKLSIAERTCPICPGDILYVRETWNTSCSNCESYECPAPCSAPKYRYKANYPDTEDKWRPSIHMPKEAARIWLRVTDVRVERLQDILISDINKEGFSRGHAIDETWYDRGKKDFAKMWDSTIKKSDLDLYGWYANPYVWVIKFERCGKPEPCVLNGVEPAEDKRPCIGYGKSDIDDEPCEMCKGCQYYSGND